MQCEIPGSTHLKIQKAQESGEPFPFGIAEIPHVIRRFTSAKLRADRNDEDIDELVILGPVNFRVGGFLEVIHQPVLRVGFPCCVPV
jgi:hypothetical protein